MRQVLDFGLNHANSAVVMATAKLFLHYTLGFDTQHQQVGALLPALLPRPVHGSAQLAPQAPAQAPSAWPPDKHDPPTPGAPPLFVVQVLETLKDPLQTLIQGREPEVVHAVLANFLVLAQRYLLAFSSVCVCMWVVRCVPAARLCGRAGSPVHAVS